MKPPSDPAVEDGRRGHPRFERAPGRLLVLPGQVSLRTTKQRQPRLPLRPEVHDLLEGIEHRAPVARHLGVARPGQRLADGCAAQRALGVRRIVELGPEQTSLAVGRQRFEPATLSFPALAARQLRAGGQRVLYSAQPRVRLREERLERRFETADGGKLGGGQVTLERESFLIVETATALLLESRPAVEETHQRRTPPRQSRRLARAPQRADDILDLPPDTSLDAFEESARRPRTGRQLEPQIDAAPRTARLSRQLVAEATQPLEGVLRSRVSGVKRWDERIVLDPERVGSQSVVRSAGRLEFPRSPELVDRDAARCPPAGGAVVVRGTEAVGLPVLSVGAPVLAPLVQLFSARELGSTLAAHGARTHRSEKRDGEQ